MGSRKKKVAEEIVERLAETPVEQPVEFVPANVYEQLQRDMDSAVLVQLMLARTFNHSITFTTEEILAADEKFRGKVVEYRFGGGQFTARLIDKPDLELRELVTYVGGGTTVS